MSITLNHMNATAGWVEWGGATCGWEGQVLTDSAPFLALNLQLGGGYLLPLPINVLQLVSDRTVFSCNAHNVIYAPEYSSMQCNATQCSVSFMSPRAQVLRLPAVGCRSRLVYPGSSLQATLQLKSGGGHTRKGFPPLPTGGVILSRTTAKAIGRTWSGGGDT